MIFVGFLFVFLVLCDSKPWEQGIYPQNVVTVPPNCPDGQEWFNGECRDVWRYNRENILPKSTNCRLGEILVNGQCQPLWRNFAKQEYLLADDSNALRPQNVITVPPNCPPGQQWINGACRDVWRQAETPRNVISVPPNCLTGQEYVNGECRDVWASLIDVAKEERQEDNADDINIDNKNVISVPNQCPAGYRPDALGICRKIFDFNNIV
ncbi:hypothetical protein K1T71_003979 [Dendrolimus kikuchii]|uniref:Uncharacterized protein n=1 Tax=Dendrolimus kikuchii TaxID=765133 RepID=A0ACC1D9R9_9NEOP|nr:hypothetical protein K1T71_003979 [Dendrolimus kikuchii]